MADRGIVVGSLVRITVPHIDLTGNSIGDAMGEIINRHWEPIPPDGPEGEWVWAWDYVVQVVGGDDYWLYREEFVVLQESDRLLDQEAKR